MEFKEIGATVFTFMALILVPAIACLILHYIGVDIRKASETAAYRNISVLNVSVTLYVTYCVFLFFFLQSVFLNIRPQPGTIAQPQAALIEQLQKVASLRNEKGELLFDSAYNDNTFVLTWSGQVFYNQGIAIGKDYKKRVFVLTLDERKHSVFLLQKNSDINWGADRFGGGLSFEFADGIFAESSAEYTPSIVLNPDKTLSIRTETLKYDSVEMFRPIRQAILQGGWSIQSGLIRSKALAASIIIFFTLITFLAMLAFDRISPPSHH